MKSSTCAVPCWLSKNGFDWPLTSQSQFRIKLTELPSLHSPSGALFRRFNPNLRLILALRRGLPAPRSSSGGRFSFSIGNPQGSLAACASRRPTGADNTPVCAYGPCASRALHACACVLSCDPCYNDSSCQRFHFGRGFISFGNAKCNKSKARFVSIIEFS